MEELETLDTLETAAQRAAGNWRKFECFLWSTRAKLEDPNAWTIHYTTQRGADAITRSNARVFAKELAPFMEGSDPDVLYERHHHWAVGWVEGYVVRVYRRKRITKAFRTLYRLLERLRDYPLLDEEGYYDELREDVLALLNLDRNRVERLAGRPLPEDWAERLYSWFCDVDQEAAEDLEQGILPSDAAMQEAVKASL